VSFNSDWNAGTKSDLVISWPTAFWSWTDGINKAYKKHLIH
jgi:hypothetical protein